MKYSLDQLRDLIEILRNGKVGEFEYEDEELRLRLNLGAPSNPQALVAPAPQPAAVAVAPTPVADAADKDIVYVSSPFVGTFYRAPSPEAAPYVQPGQVISKGQTLCIVEAMKLMNEIESDLSGTLVEILAENGMNVEFGQRLFKIRKA
jgi:acetyl-CoA carboxylase biotin carboxyl carrier protein